MTPAGPDLLARATALLPRLVDLRRRLHQVPETAWQERETRALIESELLAEGFECRQVADTGLLARVPGGAGGCAAGAPLRPVVALRAELDALPIVEATGLPFSSRHPGVMHACGHDGNMAMVFGAGLLLREMAGRLPGSVVLLYQPAEETTPSGARRIVEEGVLETAGISIVFGIHGDPRYPAGQLLLRRGPLMAASDRFRLTVVGRGGHGGYPHLTVDPVVTAAQIVLGLQAIVARRLDPTEPGVISIGRIEGGTTDNVIPDRVTLSGTLRSHSPEVRARLPEWIRQAADGIAAAAGAQCEFEYLPGHPGVANDPALIDRLEKILAPVLGPERIVDLPKPVMGAEDFSWYLERIPGAYLRVGVRNEAKGCVHPIHNARFDLDEDALAVGAAALAAAAAGWLEPGPPAR
jgi:amidohydrolase